MWEASLVEVDSGPLEAGTAQDACVHELHEATRNGEWRVMYQPIVELATRRCAGAESLLRWQHPRRGLLAPLDFIELAESSGHILAITRAILPIITSDLHRMVARGHDIYFAINLVADHFRDQRIIFNLLKAVYQLPVNATRLLLEITERGHIDVADATSVMVMNRLREHGFMLAIDDFGARDASMVYLGRFPVSHIKIDKTLVDSIEHGMKSRCVMQGLVTMARGMGLAVVAEGVETEAQARLLQSFGVHYGQGYAFARALSIGDLEDFVTEGGRAAPRCQI